MRHDTLLHPEVVSYINGQEDPMRYVNNLVNNIENFPLVLTLTELKNLEDTDFLHTSQTDESQTTMQVKPSVVEIDKLRTYKVGQDQLTSKPASQDNKLEKDSAEKKKTSFPNLPSDTTLPGAIMQEGVGAVGVVKEASSISALQEVSEGTERSADKTDAKKSFDAHDIKIMSDITGKSTCEGLIKDFNRNANHRFSTLKNIIQTQNRVFTRSIAIDKINLNYKREIYFIGMITNISTTQKGNLILSMEDETGEIRVFVKKETQQYISRLLNDEVLGIIGDINPEMKMVMAQRLIRPLPPRRRNIHRADNNVDAVFISDIHVGSTEFIEKSWYRFVQWLNGKEIPGVEETAENVRYVVVAGDLVDGIGIYPDQETELIITDIYEQYSRLAELMEDIPDHIKIIMAPGNHDAVRQAEPQPALNTDFQKYFKSNTVFIGNPCYLALHGVEILVYHGRSFDDIVKYIPEATYIQPTIPMKEMLDRRHLVPLYGERTPIAPEHRDLLLIDRLPDIFVTGHVHTAGTERYSNMLLINASAWQAQTSYQKTLNFNPDPCKAFLVNLNTIRAAEMDFSTLNL